MKASIVKIKNGLGKIVPIVRYDQNIMDSTKKYPLVVFLHGRNEYSENENVINVHRDLTRQDNVNHAGILRNADERKDFLVIAPQFIQAYNYEIRNGIPTQNWQPDFSGGYYVDDCINWALANMPIDPNKIYVTGLSSGGSGTWDYALRADKFSKKIAAIVPVCGGYPSGDLNLIVNNKISVWGFHANNDDQTPVSGTINTINELLKRGMNPEKVKKTIYSTGGHGIWGTVYSTKDLYTWLMQQSKESTPNNPDPDPEPEPTKKVIAKLYINNLEIVVYDDKTAEVKEIIN